MTPPAAHEAKDPARDPAKLLTEAWHQAIGCVSDPSTCDRRCWSKHVGDILATEPGRELLRRAEAPISVEALAAVEDALEHFDGCLTEAEHGIRHPHCRKCRDSLTAAEEALGLAALPSPDPEPARVFVGQMDWPCLCGHPKSDHYFGDRLAADGRMHTWCQRELDTCLDFRPSPDPEPVEESR